MKGSVTHALFSWALGLLVIGGIGLVLSNQWYADDACQTAEWKCEVGNLGLTASVFILPLGGLIALAALVSWVVGVMSKRA
jgi:hypothetical protein